MKTRSLTGIGAIIGFGFLLRLWPAITQPIASDEVYAIHEALYYRFPFDPASPPLFPLFLKFWLIFSHNLFWIRLPSLIAGTITIFLVWKLFLLFADRRTALMGAFLAATSSFLVRYSWFSRIYGFTMLATAASLYFFVTIALMIAKKRFPGTNILLIYTVINVIGSLLSFGFSIFLVTCALTLVLWITVTTAWGFVERHWKPTLLFVSLHGVLNLIVGWRIMTVVPTVTPTATWIAPASVRGSIGVLLALMNMSPILTGIPFRGDQVALYLILLALLTFFSLAYRIMTKRQKPLLEMFFASLIVSVLVSDWFSTFLNLSIQIPRAFIFIHLLFLTVLAPVISSPTSSFMRKVASLTVLALYFFINTMTFIHMNL